jgi:hypothetical protein
VTTVAEGADPVVLATHGPLTLSGVCAGGTVATLTVSTTEDNSATTGTDTNTFSGQTAVGSVEPDLDVTDSPFQIAELGAGMAIRGYTVTTASAFAPSGRGFSGDVAMFRDSSGAGSCRFHGSLALQG